MVRDARSAPAPTLPNVPHLVAFGTKTVGPWAAELKGSPMSPVH